MTDSMWKSLLTEVIVMLIYLDSIEQLSPHRIFITWHILAAITLERSRLWLKKKKERKKAYASQAEVMAQCIKLLLYKSVDQSLNLQNPCKTLADMAATCRQRWDIPRTNQLARLAN